MDNDNWYETTDWDISAKEFFFDNIRKSRSRKLEYTIIKARVLYLTGDDYKKTEAKKLLVDALELYKDEKFNLPNVSELLAYWYAWEGDFELSEKYARYYFKLLESGKSCRVSKNMSCRRLLMELLMLKREKYARIESKAIMDKWLLGCDPNYFPTYEYLENNAKLVDVSGDKMDGVEKACDGFEIHHSDLDYKIIHNRNQESLDYLWSHLSEFAVSTEYKVSSYYWYDDSGLQSQLFWYTAELGSYIGYVIINVVGGSWVNNIGINLMSHRILIDKEIINPFLIAYDIVKYGFAVKNVALDYGLYSCRQRTN